MGWEFSSRTDPAYHNSRPAQSKSTSIDQPSPFAAYRRALDVPVRGLSHFARRRARIGPVSRRAQSGTHLHHQISVLLGSGTRANPKPPSSPTKIGKAQASEEAIFLDSFLRNTFYWRINTTKAAELQFQGSASRAPVQALGLWLPRMLPAHAPNAAGPVLVRL